MPKTADWLKMTWSKEDYLPAAYYKRLLKKYQIQGREDIETFGDYLASLPTPKYILELGCGTGRGTDVVQKAFPNSKHTLLDLSKTMIAAVKDKYSATESNFVCNDSLAYMAACREKFDFVYSLWSLSHSVHQTMERLLDSGQDFSSIESTIRKFLTQNIQPGGQFYLIHFDSQSDEQRILLKQWARVHPLYADYKEPSQSFKMLTQLLKKMEAEDLLKFEVSRCIGDPIVYESLEEALEVFINFHLEGVLQGYSCINEVIDDMTDYFSSYTGADGRISICPAWYVIKISL